LTAKIVPQGTLDAGAYQDYRGVKNRAEV